MQSQATQSGMLQFTQRQSHSQPKISDQMPSNQTESTARGKFYEKPMGFSSMVHINAINAINIYLLFAVCCRCRYVKLFLKYLWRNENVWNFSSSFVVIYIIYNT